MTIQQLPVVGARCAPTLLADARRATALPDGAPDSAVVRWALAALAGRPDPADIATTGGRGYTTTATATATADMTTA